MKDTNTGVDYFVEAIAHLLADVYTSPLGLNTHELSLDLKKIKRRARNEGSSFFTKQLPALGKRVDYSLTSGKPLDCRGFLSKAKVPKLFGGLFKLVFTPDGRVREDASSQCIRMIRDLTYLFYKYEIPSQPDAEQKVIDTFIANERDIQSFSARHARIFPSFHCASDDVMSPDALQCDLGPWAYYPIDQYITLVHAMRREAARLFSSCSVECILPHHGPGIVSTGEQLEFKYSFPRYSAKIDAIYPYTRYFIPSVMDDRCDLNVIAGLPDDCPPARVLLVPKDSRGPRLISAEPLENQYIQQGIKDIIVPFIESHPVMGGHVNFTDQSINRQLALTGSLSENSWCTLDLKDASDRIALELLITVMPGHLLEAFMCCRSSATQLPDGRVVQLSKFAPMGSALCFPVLASIVWLALTSGNDACSRETTFVYGDDIIVQKHDVLNAIKRLEMIGLTVNRDKSCYTGLFRESCGMDAYNGICVTPFRLRKVCSQPPNAEDIVSSIAKANEAYDRGYSRLASFLADDILRRVSPHTGDNYSYKTVLAKGLPYIETSIISENDVPAALLNEPHFTFIPLPVVRDGDDEELALWEGNPRLDAPYGLAMSFRDGGRMWFDRKRRASQTLQRVQWLVYELVNVAHRSKEENLSYFRSLINGARKQFKNPLSCGPDRRSDQIGSSTGISILEVSPSGSASVYTHNRASKLVRKWR